jgi:hypothetical protein
MERGAHLHSLLLYILQGSSKGALPPGSPHRAPIKREIPFPEPSFNLSFEVFGK